MHNIRQWYTQERERLAITTDLDNREQDAYANDREVYTQKLQAREAIRDSITIVIVLAIAAWPVGKMLLSLID